MPTPREQPDRRDIRDVLDIDGLRAPSHSSVRPSVDADARAGGVRNFLMIWFRCCETYGRLPKSRDGACYEGRCPKCHARLTVPIGSGGTNRRMFEAG